MNCVEDSTHLGCTSLLSLKVSCPKYQICTTCWPGISKRKSSPITGTSLTRELSFTFQSIPRIFEVQILVTGATGFLGKVLCTQLEEQGHELVRLHSKNCDLTRQESLQQFNDQAYDRIY